jgi:hypothetical protein
MLQKQGIVHFHVCSIVICNCRETIIYFVCWLHRKRKREKKVVCTIEDSPAKNTRSKRPSRIKKIRRILDL